MDTDEGEVLSCYYFLPGLGEEGSIHQFVLSMTITERLNSWNLDFMREAISKINYILQTGMMELIGYHITESAQYVSLWMDALLELNAGNISMEE